MGSCSEHLRRLVCEHLMSLMRGIPLKSSVHQEGTHCPRERTRPWLHRLHCSQLPCCKEATFLVWVLVLEVMLKGSVHKR